MEYKKLKGVAIINMGQSPDSSSYNESGEGVPFFQGKADFGDINPVVRMYTSSPKKLAEESDILMSVRAPVGDVNIADRECCIGRGLCAIRADKCINNKFLYYYLITKKEELNSMATGSTFKAINKSILESIDVPMLSLETQNKVADILDKAQELIDKRKAQIEALDELVKSRFIEMFGDPVSNPMEWNMDKLSNMGDLGRGVSKHRPRNAPELLGGIYPLIQTGDVANSDLYIKRYNATYSELGLKQSKMWEKGTLCITIAANIAKVGILKFDACFPDSVVGFQSNDKTNNIFMYYWFNFFQKLLENQAPESAQKNINLKILGELKVVQPPIEFQNEFADFVKQVYKLKSQMQDSLKELEDNFNSLMQKAFKGELFN